MLQLRQMQNKFSKMVPAVEHKQKQNGFNIDIHAHSIKVAALLNNKTQT